MPVIPPGVPAVRTVAVGGPSGPQGVPGQSAIQRVAASAMTAGQVVRTHASGQQMQPATTDLRTRPFDAILLGDIGSGATGNFHVAGPVPANVLQLGAGVACAVGVDASGTPVRATDPTCVSAPNWVGFCDANGNVTIAPVRKDFYDVRDFGAIPDFVYNNPSAATDNLAAFDACMAASAVLSSGPPLIAQDVEIIAPGSYYLSDTWHFTHTVHFNGSGNNANEQAVPGTMLVFPKNVTGIYIHADGDGSGYQASRSAVRDCVIYCKDAPTSPVAPIADPSWTGTGVYSRATCYLENVLVQGFGCSDASTGPVNIGGISLIGNAGARLPPPAGPLEWPGNVDDSVVRDCFVANCGGHGLFIAGNDGNSIKVSGFAHTNNWGWGVYDVGGGSIYTGATGQGNRGNFSVPLCSIAGGSSILHAPNPNNGPGSPLNIQAPWIVGQQIAIPGLNASGVRTVVSVDISADPALITIDVPADVGVGPVTVTGGSIVDSKNHDYKAGDTYHLAFTVSSFIGCYSEASVGGLVNDINDPCIVVGGLLAQGEFYSPNILVMNGNNLPSAGFRKSCTLGAKTVVTTFGENSTNQRAFAVQDESGNYWSFQFDDVHGVWGWSVNGSGIWSMGFPTPATNTGSRPTNVLVMRTGLYIGQPGGPQTPECTLVIADSAAPISGTWSRGDVVMNNAPSAGGFAGWICVASGTPGTWKTFGPISA